MTWKNIFYGWKVVFNCTLFGVSVSDAKRYIFLFNSFNFFPIFFKLSWILLVWVFKALYFKIPFKLFQKYWKTCVSKVSVSDAYAKKVQNRACLLVTLIVSVSDTNKCLLLTLITSVTDVYELMSLTDINNI